MYLKHRLQGAVLDVSHWVLLRVPDQLGAAKWEEGRWLEKAKFGADVKEASRN